MSSREGRAGKGVGALALASLAMSISAASVAQTEPARRAGVLEEIIVTGTKRDTSQQDTPIAISTITAEQINRTFGNDVRVIGDLSPNVTLTNQTGFNALAGGIRGTGTISILTTQDPSVGLLVDEFALNHVQSQFVELFDLEQVEIYRGPQGTLFGKNSTGGVITIRSKRPSLDEYGADIRVVGGRYNGGANTQKVQVGFDVPLIENRLGFRMAASYTDEDGYYTNDKDTATFPNSPFNALIGVTPDQLPAELSQSTRGAGERLGGKKVLAAKSKLLWQPNDMYEAYFIWEVVRDDSDAPPGVNETPAGEGFLLPLLGFPGIQEAGHRNPFSTGATQQGGAIRMRDGHRVDIDGFYLTQNLDFERFSLRSITGYREQDEILPSTYTGEAFLSLFDATRNLQREQFQQELRFVSNFEGPLNFVAGGIYLTDDLEFVAYSTVGLTSLFPPFDLRQITRDPNVGSLTQDRKSLAFYLDGSWDVNEKITLSAGVRWTQDKKDFFNPVGGGGPCNQFTLEQDAILVDPSLPFDPVTNCEADALSGRVSRSGLSASEVSMRQNPLPNSAYRFQVDTKEKWTETTWRLVGDYKFSDEGMVYASIATGFLSGGFSETCLQPQTCVPYNPETNINYEIGLKADLLDRRLRLNMALFWTDFEDLQRNQVFEFTNFDGSPGQETITLNAGKSRSRGAELEATWIVTPSLQFRGSAGWLDAKYREFEFDPNPLDPTVAPVDLTGLDIPFSPKWQLAGELMWDQNLGNGGTLQWVGGVHYQSSAETSPFDPNAVAVGVARHPTFTAMESRTLVHANITYMDPTERYHVSLFGKNLTNETYRVSANSVGNLWNFTQFGAPRHIGVELGVTF
ncbi:MAG: TonB-dependent receptor [Gammaproteobacteria bacterium]|nr:TonB-dependent receptor [Gammaproteobacteria bacterium]